MRTLHELYKLLLESFENRSSKFICNALNNMLKSQIISHEEHELVEKHLEENFPSKTLHQEFFNHPSYNKDEKWLSRWDCYIDGHHEQRTLFIQKMIEITQ